MMKLRSLQVRLVGVAVDVADVYAQLAGGLAAGRHGGNRVLTAISLLFFSSLPFRFFSFSLFLPLSLYFVSLLVQDAPHVVSAVS